MPQQTELAKMLGFNMPQAEAPTAPATVEAPKAEEPGLNEKWAQAILAFAPILAGAAVGGARGGAIGAEAGLSGLGMYQRGKKEEQEKAEKKTKEEKELAQAKVKQAIELAKEQRATAAEERAMKLAELAERRELRAEGRDVQAAKRQAAELGLKEKELALKATQEKQLPSSQYLAGTYARRLEQAEQVFDKLAEGGYSRAATSQRFAGLLPKELQSSARLANEQAERNFVNSILRRESGAAISEAEFKNAEQQYFPRPGDDANTIAQKKANRLQAMAGLQAEAGKALEKIPLVAVQPAGRRAGVTGGTKEAMASSKPGFMGETVRQNGVTYQWNEEAGRYE